MTDLETILAYHERTKHRYEAYAAGPETLDWSAQPNPFRGYAGAAKTMLPLAADSLATPFADLYRPGAVAAHASRAIDMNSVGLLLELSMAISAWKEYGPDRWALRCNPSSGNLHPTEAYVVCRNIPGLADGVHHYLSLDHSLELRCRFAPNPAAALSLHVGLSSIAWREAWKYGERAFRYYQLDAGHALGALRYAAAALGWQAHCRDALGGDDIARLLGLDRDADFGQAEREEAELLIAVGSALPPPVPTPDAAAGEWSGQANVLDPHPLYRWPIIDAVAAASRQPSASASTPGWRPLFGPEPTLSSCKLPAATVIRQRRSAQAFDRNASIAADVFYRLLDALLPRDAAPWNVWAWKPRVHPVLFVHRVAGIAPGIYALPRTPAAAQSLRAALRADFAWSRPPGCPDHLPLYCLIEADTAKVARSISCHQAIAADGAFSLAMLAEFEGVLTDAPWRYRRLFHEAGLLGQVLYLEAEAAGMRGTGIGCYFDDAVHELLGLAAGDKTFQSLYHFTVGVPLVDERISTLPAYSLTRPTQEQA